MDESLAEYVRRLVDSAPELSPDVRGRLRPLLRIEPERLTNAPEGIAA